VSTIFGCDPGPTQSGWCLFSPPSDVVDSGVADNHDLLVWLRATRADVLAIETMQATYGTVGASVIDTLIWVGRFRQAWRDPDAVRLISRQSVKAHVCNGNTKASDSGVRQALIDLLGPVGTKRQPGPCYGVKSHAWAALAVAVIVSRETGAQDALSIMQAHIGIEKAKS
jgi:hypothetical protein